MDQKVFETFIEFGERLHKKSLKVPYGKALQGNPWFDEDSVNQALEGIQKYIHKDSLIRWQKRYKKPARKKVIGLITAGNIPLVGFHDILCILLAGHGLKFQPSSKDLPLSRWLVNKLISLNPSLSKRIEVVKSLGKCDAYIATGTDNTTRYFEFEFRKMPYLVRGNKTSIAILDGTESTQQLHNLFNDIFSYYGLGCRNVSCLLLPEDYSIDKLKPFVKPHSWRVTNQAYLANYKYNKALCKLNGDKTISTKVLLFRKSNEVFSSIGTVNYWHYKNQNEVHKFLEENSGSLQCVVSQSTKGLDSINFGQSQFPEVDDYQDGIDTMKFLTNL